MAAPSPGQAAAGGRLRTAAAGDPRGGGRVGAVAAGCDSRLHRPDGRPAWRARRPASTGGTPGGGPDGPSSPGSPGSPGRRLRRRIHPHGPRRRRGPGRVAPGVALRPDGRATGGRGRVGRCRRPRRDQPPRRDHRARRAVVRQTRPGRAIGIRREARRPAGADAGSAAQAPEGVPTRRQRCPSRESSTTIPRAARSSRRRSEAAQSRAPRAAAR